MTSLSQLQKDVEILRHALNVDVPEWKERSNEISVLLQKYEQLGLTTSQEREIVKEVVKDLQKKDFGKCPKMSMSKGMK